MCWKREGRGLRVEAVTLSIACWHGPAWVWLVRQVPEVLTEHGVPPMPPDGMPLSFSARHVLMCLGGAVAVVRSWGNARHLCTPPLVGECKAAVGTLECILAVSWRTGASCAAYCLAGPSCSLPVYTWGLPARHGEATLADTTGPCAVLMGTAPAHDCNTFSSFGVWIFSANLSVFSRILGSNVHALWAGGVRWSTALGLGVNGAGNGVHPPGREGGRKVVAYRYLHFRTVAQAC